MTNTLESKKMIIFLDTVIVTGAKHVVAGIHHQTGTIDVVMKSGKFAGQTIKCECSSANFAAGERIWVGGRVA